MLERKNARRISPILIIAIMSLVVIPHAIPSAFAAQKTFKVEGERIDKIPIVPEGEFKIDWDPCRIGKDHNGPYTTEQLACIGRPYGDAIAEMQAHDPSADAVQALRKGNFALYVITRNGRGPSPPGIQCLLLPSEALTAKSMVFSHVIGGPRDIYWRESYERYTEAYNRTLVGHPDYPYKDICYGSEDRQDDEDRSVQDEITTWRERTAFSAPAETLIDAVRLGQLERVQMLLTKGGDPNASDDWALLPLHWAALRGDADLTRLLLDKGAKADALCEKGMPVIDAAIFGGNARVADMLLAAGADLEAYGNSWNAVRFRLGIPLVSATRLGYLDVMEVLLKHDRKIENIDKALWFAVETENLKAVKLLLEQGATGAFHTTFGSFSGQSAIQLAVKKDAPAMVRAMIPLAAATEARSAQEEAAWLAALDQPRYKLPMMLVRWGYSLHFLTPEQQLELQSAISAGNTDAVRLLIQKSHHRAASFHIALADQDTDSAKAIIESSSGLMRGHGESELVAAVWRGNNDIVQFLLERGANPDAQVHPMVTGTDTLNWPSLFVQTLAKNNPRTNAVKLAFQMGNIDVIRGITDASTKPYPNDFTKPAGPIIEALFGYRRHGNAEAIAAALEFGGAPEKVGGQADGLFAKLCFWTGDRAAWFVQYYLSKGYLPRQRDDPLKDQRYPGDDMALHECLTAGPEAAKLLLDAGADPNQVNSIDGTPLREAVKRLNSRDNTLDLIRDFLQAGADPNSPDGYDRAVLDYALARSKAKLKPERKALFADAVTLLRHYGAKTRDELVTEGALGPLPEPVFQLSPF